MNVIYSKKNIIIAITTLIVIAIGVSISLFYLSNKKIEDQLPVSTINTPLFRQEIIGKSVQGRSIEAFTFGQGSTSIGFVGGIHGGYEWNSVLLAYKLINYLKNNSSEIPKNLSVTIIPSANPDGVYKVVGKEGEFTIADLSKNTDESLGRFNANNVDLNRNFDCKWQATSTWRNKTVSAGTSAFSEPEARAIKSFVDKNHPKAMIFLHSQSNAVYASECKNGILATTKDIMNVYAGAAGYPAVDNFSSYTITGDAEGWLASINIPAITVELKTHESVEWEKNILGIKAIFNYFSNKVF